MKKYKDKLPIISSTNDEAEHLLLVHVQCKEGNSKQITVTRPMSLSNDTLCITVPFFNVDRVIHLMIVTKIENLLTRRHHYLSPVVSLC